MLIVGGILYRKTYALIDCDVIKSNIEKIRETYNDYKYYFGVVKANAYGHGIYVINAMIDAGINYLAVATLEEALNIRKLNKKISILVLEPIDASNAKVAALNNITITIDDVENFKDILNQKVKLKFHMKIDTGMNRFGLKKSEDADYIYKNSNNILVLEGIFTQLYSGFGEELKKEENRFLEITKNIDLSKVPIVHLDRSLTLEQHERFSFANGVRLGIIMYGFPKRVYQPSLKRRIYNFVLRKKTTSEESVLKLNTAFKFYTTVMETKSVLPGEVVGYGGMYDSKENSKIAILPYGFADFTFIKPTNVYIKNKKYKIISNYMDITSVIVDDSVKSGDMVEIFGDIIKIREAAEEAGVNVYKLLCSVTTRVPRVYKYQNKEVEVNYLGGLDEKI